MCLLGVQIVTENPLDLLKIAAAMRSGNRGAMLPDGAAAPKAKAKAARPGMRNGGDGFAIPDALKERLGRFDTNKDGRLSTSEVDAMPEPARTRVRDAVRDRTGGGGGSNNL